MNLATKICKFKNAVWKYRGRYDEKTKIWDKRPTPSAKALVLKGFERLGIEPAHGMKKIDKLKNKGEFDKWIGEIAEEKREQYRVQPREVK